MSSVYGTQVGLGDSGVAVAVWVESDPQAGTSIVRAAARLPGRRWQSPQTLSTPGARGRLPDLAVDRTGSAVAVWVEDDRGSQVAIRPATGRFGRTVALTRGELLGEPKVAVDRRGRAIVVGSRDGVVRVADGTVSGGFGPVRDLSAGAYPAVAATSAGDVVVAWTHAGAIEAVTRVGSGAFGSVEVLGTAAASGFDLSGPSVAIGPGGDAIVAWGTERFPTPPALVRAALRTKSGQWGQTETVGAAGDRASTPAVAIDARGTATVLWVADNYVTWPLYAARRLPGGGFTEPQLLSPDAGGASLGIRPTGEAVALWSRYAGDWVVMTAICPPGGERFGFAHALSRSGYNAGGAGYNGPAVAFGASGDGIGAWGRSDGRKTLMEAAGYDGAGPQLHSLRVPERGSAGRPLVLSVAPVDVWSRVVTTRWRFGDGTSGVGARVTHTYASAGAFTVTVSSKDALGHRTSATRTVRITSRAGG